MELPKKIYIVRCWCSIYSHDEVMIGGCLLVSDWQLSNRSSHENSAVLELELDDVTGTSYARRVLWPILGYMRLVRCPCV